jgi:hypothetical protein
MPMLSFRANTCLFKSHIVSVPLLRRMEGAVEHFEAESGAAMKLAAVIALLMVGLSVPTLGQEKASCKAFFQVVQMDARTDNGNLRAGMDSAQKKWWESKGQKKYPDLCWNGAILARDKPRYLLIWSKSGSSDDIAKPSETGPTKAIQQTVSIATSDVYGQTAADIRRTDPTALIYKRRWDVAQLSIVSVSFDEKMVVPPVYVPVPDTAYWWSRSDSPKVLEVALKYIAQEPPPPPPPVSPAVGPAVTLQISPTVIQSGQSATLSWSSTNATALNLTPAIGTVSPGGMISVTPADSTNYTITAIGPGGGANTTVRITVSFFSLKTD